MSRAIFFNSLINLLWTAVCCTPVLLYWLAEGHPFRLYVELGVSLAFMFAPASFFRKTQLSSNRKFYEGLGVKQAQFFTQNGKAINTILRSADPAYKVVRSSAGIIAFRGQMEAYERFHLSCLVFFFATFIEALASAQYGLSFFIFTSNIIYNVYPLLIQQYNRTRISSILKIR